VVQRNNAVGEKESNRKKLFATSQQHNIFIVLCSSAWSHTCFDCCSDKLVSAQPSFPGIRFCVTRTLVLWTICGYFGRKDFCYLGDVNQLHSGMNTEGFVSAQHFSAVFYWGVLGLGTYVYKRCATCICRSMKKLSGIGFQLKQDNNDSLLNCYIQAEQAKRF